MFKFLERLFGIKQKYSNQSTDSEKTTPAREDINETGNTATTQNPYRKSYRENARLEASRKIGESDSKDNINQQKASNTRTNNSSEKELPSTQSTTVEQRKTAAPVAAEKETQKRTSPAVRTATAPAQNVTSRRVVAPRAQRHIEVAPEKRVQKSSVYIGLDFGTTFTKAAYEIAPSNVHTKYSVKFGKGDSREDYYLPSVLYFDADTGRLKISDEAGCCEEIRYFKYNMISNALQKNKVLNDPSIVTQTVKEQLCSVFFLSYVIYLIRNSVYQNFERIKDIDTTAWYINMGVPLEAQKNDKRAALYKKVLEIAFLFEQKYHGITEIDIHELDKFYSEHSNESNPNINILPEIYAEVLLYQQYLNTPAGFYTVVDIGGGTEDIATFLKMTDRTGEKVDCLAQNVIGYGYDSISERIVETLEPESIGKAKALLCQKIDFNNDASIQSALPIGISLNKLLNARRECRTLFGTCVQRARRTKVEVLEQTVNARLPMHVFVMGGARSVEFYRSSIEYMKKAQENAGIPFFKDADVFDYAGRNTQLEIRNDQRLIISQMLAQPFEMIPEINNMPWDLKEKDVNSKGISWIALQERQNELYPD